MHPHSNEAAKARLAELNRELKVARFEQQAAWDRALTRLDQSITGWAAANRPDDLKALHDAGINYAVIAGSGGQIFSIAEEFEPHLPADKRAEIKRAEEQVKEAETKVKDIQAEFQKLAAQVSGDRGVGIAGLFAFGRDEIEAGREMLCGGHPAITMGVTPTTMPQAGLADSRVGEDFPLPVEVPVVARLFPTFTTDAGSVEIFRQKALATAAAPVAIDADKPESDPQWEAITLTVQTLAHLATVENRVLSDFASWQAFVGREMGAGLMRALDSQILSGSGVSPQLDGILSAANRLLINNVDRDSTNNELRSEAIHRAITALRTVGYVEATDIIIHPSDLEKIRFEKVSAVGDPGQFAFVNGSPLDPEIGGLWGVRVTATTAIDAGEALVLNPQMAGRLYVREGASLVANQYGDVVFKKNQITLRNEMRVAFGLVMPAAVCGVLLD